MQGYDEWSAKYRRAFSLTKEEDAELFIEWEAFFERAGFTLDDLEAAFAELSLAPPQTRPAHLKAIMDLGKRFKAGRSAQIAPSLHGNCELCSYGYVIVPHPGTINGTVNGYHTMAIACCCQDGQRLIPHVKLDLESYDRLFPSWRLFAREHEEDRLARCGLLGVKDDPEAMQAVIKRRVPEMAKMIDSVTRMLLLPRREKGRMPPPGRSIEDWLREEVG